jgi:hypothetical protein
MAKYVIPEQKAIEVENNIETPRLTLSELTDVYNAKDEELPSHA